MAALSDQTAARSDHGLRVAPPEAAMEATSSHGSTVAPGGEPHPDTDAILRQIEFYFCDERLAGDAHLLAKTGGDGNGPVSINHITGFPKMRKYKPKSRVIASLRLSKMVKIVDDKYIQRREPLKVPLRVEPQLSKCDNTCKLLEAKPWLTKGMLKPTGFEDYANDGPISPEEYEQERQLYDAEEQFHVRIDSAVARYEGKRKMHSLTRDIFHKFMFYGGFNTGQKQFSGGVSVKNMDSHTKDDLVQLSSGTSTSEQVLDGLHTDEQFSGRATWIVDFETIAKGFLSSYFMSKFLWHDKETLDKAGTVLSNFYNYLMYHDVCPEYNDQILKARAVCSQAQAELPKIWAVDCGLPGQFNMACSILFEGTWSDQYYKPGPNGALSGSGDGDLALSRKESFTVFVTGIMAHGTEDQMARVDKADMNNLAFETVFQEDVGLEILGIELADEDSVAGPVYASEHIQDTFIRPVGKLLCKSWEAPHAPLQDLSPEHEESVRKAMSGQLSFLVDDEVLRDCHQGVKIEAHVRELDIGIRWIDRIEKIYPSFYTWTKNEIMREYRAPGPPTDWMLRQNEQKQTSLDCSASQSLRNCVSGTDGEAGEL